MTSGCGSDESTGESGSTAAPAPAVGNQAPTLTALQLSADSVDFMAGGGRTMIGSTVRFTDLESDVSTLHVALSDGSSTTVPVNVTTTAGQTVGEFSVPASAAGPAFLVGQ